MYNDTQIQISYSKNHIQSSKGAQVITFPKAWEEYDTQFPISYSKSMRGAQVITFPKAWEVYKYSNSNVQTLKPKYHITNIIFQNHLDVQNENISN